MGRVIKAAYTKYGDDDKEKEQPLEETMTQDSVQAAYDELIAAAVEEANLRLRDADNEAANIVAKARMEADRLYGSAREEGYNDGYSQARAACDDMLGQVQRELENICDSAERERNEKLAALENGALDLAVNIAGKILALELDRNDQAYMSMIQGALENVRTEKMVTLRVNPGEYMRHFNTPEMTISTANGNISASVVSDAAIGPYGAIIDTESGSIDAGAEAQLSQIRGSLEEQV